MRGKGNGGASEAARAALRQIDLAAFVTADDTKFRRRLDAETLRLQSRLPSGAQHWGLARKVLNIYLRDCFYTRYLYDAFGLQSVEPHLEVPLDRYVAAKLKEARPRQLPPWRGVRHVSPAESAVFQAAAQQEAEKIGLARVHLDAFYWSAARDQLS